MKNKTRIIFSLLIVMMLLSSSVCFGKELEEISINKGRACLYLDTSVWTVYSDPNELVDDEGNSLFPELEDEKNFGCLAIRETADSDILYFYVIFDNSCESDDYDTLSDEEIKQQFSEDISVEKITGYPFAVANCEDESKNIHGKIYSTVAYGCQYYITVYKVNNAFTEEDNLIMRDILANFDFYENTDFQVYLIILLLFIFAGIIGIVIIEKIRKGKNKLNSIKGKNESTLVDNIESLHNAGVLSDIEFEDKKKQIIIAEKYKNIDSILKALVDEDVITLEEYNEYKDKYFI